MASTATRSKGKLRAQIEDELRTLIVDPATYEAQQKACLGGDHNLGGTAPARLTVGLLSCAPMCAAVLRCMMWQHRLMNRFALTGYCCMATCNASLHLTYMVQTGSEHP